MEYYCQNAYPWQPTKNVQYPFAITIAIFIKINTIFHEKYEYVLFVHVNIVTTVNMCMYLFEHRVTMVMVYREKDNV